MHGYFIACIIFLKLIMSVSQSFCSYFHKQFSKLLLTFKTSTYRCDLFVILPKLKFIFSIEIKY